MSRVGICFLGLLLGLVGLLLIMSPAHALSHGVVISAVQVGDAQSASNEIIELYNNADSDADVTNWCLFYASASVTTNGTKIACFTPQDAGDHLLLPSHQGASFVSKQLVVNQPDVQYDGLFSSTLASTGGHVRLLDALGVEVDKVGWGAAIAPEGIAASVPTNNTVLSRTLQAKTYVDTDNNSLDFRLTAPQSSFPFGFVYDQEDVCLNIDDVQLAVPSDMVVDDAGNCTMPVEDHCLNMLGVQGEVPTGYRQDGDKLCWLLVAPLMINELLPNPAGADAGKEFIELYNPTATDVPLKTYVLKMGATLQTTLKFTRGEVIPANGYFVLSNANYAFTLPNSTYLVALMTTDGQLVDQIVPYSDPNDSAAWAMIDGVWQYTTTPTPGAANILSFDSVDPDMVAAGVALAPCAANQYRNPATGRCKLLSGQGSTLAPCQANQYRSSETGRCKKIAITTAASVCSTGQVRNETTHRCRKVISATPPKAGYKTVGTSASSGSTYIFWTIVGIGALAIGYAIWEWHSELTKLWQRTYRFVAVRK